MESRTAHPALSFVAHPSNSCTPHPLALSLPQANHSQPQGHRGEEPEKSQHLIGNGLTDWMTEEVDFASYLPAPHSSPSPSSSLPPSPLQQDIQVPSDLEVMTSLLQEELAQLEDYFLADSFSEKALKLAKYDKVPTASGPQSYYQLPYASYSNSGQSESSPLLVTLATGELDLLSFCGGPISRSKTQRHTPYGFSCPNSNGRRRFFDGVRFGEGVGGSIWNSKGSNSVSPEVAVTGGYCCVEDEKTVGKKCCFGSVAEIRKCSILEKEKNYGFTEVGEKIGEGYTFCDEAPDISHKKEEQLMYDVQVISSNDGMVTEAFGDHICSEMAQTFAWKTEMGCFLQSGADGVHHSFLGGIDEPVRAGGLEMGCQHSNFSDILEDQSSECLSGEEGEDFGSAGHLADLGLKEDPTGATSSQEAPLEAHHGEHRQKKRDQNKTAAYRYRQRKRAELDSLEEQLHGLEGRNRELRDKAESVEREIQYVKDLLIEVYKARSQRLKRDTSP
ncbi:hypothetical protein AAFF_G00168280 [Aldrovandia affinis]|uniref:BZIP domain-containing protein n=1 Tax=Aldrovandia affinis TaxID=143900 RepID=A0AAD7RLN6_9TELE|nr:hypothetical protein AAFF_G00168280 [Aldrovandia affinis]